MLRDFNSGDGGGFSARFTRVADFFPYDGSAFALRGTRIGRVRIAQYVRARHRVGDALSAELLDPPTSTDGVTAVYGVTVHAFVGGKTYVNGLKLVLDCRSGQVINWGGPVLAARPQ